MTNRNVVKGAGETVARKMPEPNPAPPTSVPALESDRHPWTTRDPLDSPQPKPMIRQDRIKGLRKP